MSIEKIKIVEKELPRPKLKNFSIENQIFQIPPHYKIDKILGTGAYGIVVSAYDKLKKRNVAIKKIFKIFERDEKDGFLTKRILREIRILEHFRYFDNIITLKDLIPPLSYEKFTDVYIVMDLTETDLKSLLGSQQSFDTKTVKYLTYQLIKGIKIIHSADVVHRDIKPSNILVNGNLDLMYCDFGLSRGINNDDPIMSTPYVVTRWYRAPELLMMYEKASKQFDIWSIGCIFFELLQNHPRTPIFQGKNYLHQLDLILDLLGTPKDDEIKACKSGYEYIKGLTWRSKKSLKDHELMPVETDEYAIDLLSKMLVFDPDKRITAAEALKHPYFEEFHNDDDEPSCNHYLELDESLNDKETFKKMIYSEIQEWTKRVNHQKGDAELVDEEIHYLD